MPSVWPQEAEVHHPITADNGPSNVTARAIALWKRTLQSLLRSASQPSCIPFCISASVPGIYAGVCQQGLLINSIALLLAGQALSNR
jgi:hypothetical protein